MNTHGFTLISEDYVEEIGSRALLYRHERTGAEVLSILNEDENKVFGISFRTPPTDSTGVAHILEHSVLCGSRKYPSKEPFVELLKGSLQTFLNAMTYPDKTCYPVASQNVQDFYNLIDVYLDAVFHPRIDKYIFMQEGWHLEPREGTPGIAFKGVVYNEMKGAYSSPDSMLSEHSQQTLFPDTTYGFDSGGHPEVIPDLTYEDFSDFHRRYYNPSNARIFFYGDDDPQKRLEILAAYLDEFEPLEVQSEVGMQSRFEEPREFTFPFDVSEGEESKGMVTVNFLLGDTLDPEYNLAMNILDYILVGMPASPLRKGLIDSGLGEDLAGHGLEDELRQLYFSTGLKGVKPENLNTVRDLVLSILEEVAKNGIDPRTVESAVNTIEFRLRENNAGSYPRGLLVMLRSLTTWLYDGDPLALLRFNDPLDRIKSRIKGGEPFFEQLIRENFLANTHRSTVFLTPDPDLGQRREKKERARLAEIRTGLSREDFEKIGKEAEVLTTLQETPDSPEALNAIPQLTISDLEREVKTIPLEEVEGAPCTFLFHDVPTNGICYLDLGFNLHMVPQKLISYVPLFGRALLEMGTATEDFVSLTQRIRSQTGGINSDTFASGSLKDPRGAAWLFFRGKSMDDKTPAMLEIFRDILLEARLDDRNRFKQILLEEKAALERSLIPAGHRIVDLRLRSRFSDADWAEESMSGISYLFFLRFLVSEVENNWERVVENLESVRRHLLTQKGMILNVTADGTMFQKHHNELIELAQSVSEQEIQEQKKRIVDCCFESEGMTIPAQVNYVGKVVDLHKAGYRFHGSGLVVSRYLRASWLWEQVRVRGGAYGAFCLFDRLTGIMTFVSYRDPNILNTLQVFDRSREFLLETPLEEGELNKAVVGAIGDMDKYLLPDAKGYVSMLRHITGDSDELRQAMRNEILSTRREDFREFAAFLEQLQNEEMVSILGAEEAIAQAREQGVQLANVFKVL
ncbi:MAG: insulinase family protein [Desulfovibrionales bacterium]